MIVAARIPGIVGLTPTRPHPLATEAATDGRRVSSALPRLLERLWLQVL